MHCVHTDLFLDTKALISKQPAAAAAFSTQKPDHYSEWYKLVTPHAPFQQPHRFFFFVKPKLVLKLSSTSKIQSKIENSPI